MQRRLCGTIDRRSLCGAIESFGARAEDLITLARYVLERDR